MGPGAHGQFVLNARLRIVAGQVGQFSGRIDKLGEQERQVGRLVPVAGGPPGANLQGQAVGTDRCVRHGRRERGPIELRLADGFVDAALNLGRVCALAGVHGIPAGLTRGAEAEDQRTAHHGHLARLQLAAAHQPSLHGHVERHHVAGLPRSLDRTPIAGFGRTAGRLAIDGDGGRLAPARNAQRHGKLRRSRRLDREDHLARVRIVGLLPQSHGEVVGNGHVGRRGRVEIDQHAAVGRAVVDHFRQFGHDSPPVAGAAVGIVGIVLARAVDGGEVAQAASVGRLGGEQGVVDRPLHDVAVERLAFQLQQVVRHADQIGRGAAFAHVAASLLVVAKPLGQAARAGDHQAVVFGQIVDDATALGQERLVRLLAIQIQLRQASVHERVGMAVAAAVLAGIDHVDRRVPAAQILAIDDVIAVSGVAGGFAQRDHGAFDVDFAYQLRIPRCNGALVVLEDVVGQFSSGVERRLVVEAPIIVHQGVDVVGHLMLIKDVANSRSRPETCRCSRRRVAWRSVP